MVYFLEILLMTIFLTNEIRMTQGLFMRLLDDILRFSRRGI